MSDRVAVEETCGFLIEQRREVELANLVAIAFPHPARLIELQKEYLRKINMAACVQGFGCRRWLTVRRAVGRRSKAAKERTRGRCGREVLGSVLWGFE